MILYLIRHGESQHNVDRDVMAHTHDSKHPLTDLGKKQAEKTAHFMQGEVNENTVLYASPYQRTIETAKVIYSRLADTVPFYENPLLREWELGNLYDFHHDRPPEVKREFKAAGSFYFRYKNGESFADVYLRASMFLSTIVQPLEQKGSYDNIVIVTHAAFIHALLGFRLNWPVEKMTGFDPVENGAVIKLYEEDAGYQFKKIFVPTV